jgi:TPR repeat protein
MFADGLGVPRNEAQAALFFAKALEQANGNLPEAAWHLAGLYQTGKGVPQDEVFADHLRHFALGLDINRLEPESLDFLAGLWEEGAAGSQNLGQAALLYDRIGKSEKADLLITRGVAANDPESLYLQGLYLIGDQARAAFPVDPSKGEAVLRRAADLGHEAAAYRLSKLLASRQPQGSEDAEAIRYLQLATTGKHPYPLALFEWGNHLLGKEEGSPAEALTFLEQAAAGGVNQAFPVLGQWYAKGTGGPADALKAARAFLQGGEPDKATTLILKAVKENVPGATLELATLYLKQQKTSAALDVLKEAVKQGDQGARLLEGAIQFGDYGPDGTDSQGAVMALLQGARNGDYPDAALLARHTIALPGATCRLLDSQKEALLKVLAQGTEVHDPDASLAQAVLWLEEPSTPHLVEALRIEDDVLANPARYPDGKAVSACLAQASDMLIQVGSSFKNNELAIR